MFALLANAPDDPVIEDKPSPLPNAIPVPAGADDLAPRYDLTLSHPEIEQETFAAFDRWLAQAAAEYGLSCALIHQGVIEEAIRRRGRGQLFIGFHLDYFALWNDPTDPYARLADILQKEEMGKLSFAAR